MGVKLNKQEIDKLSLGFVWNPNMGYVEFAGRNKSIKEDSWELYNKIEMNYIQHVYA